jgi:hypothetical protein
MGVAAHGDPHLDNLLAATSGGIAFTFVDPRGELHLEPTYDFAKLLKAARTGYDAIHYGKRHVDIRESENALRIELSVDQRWTDHYAEVLAVLVRAVPRYAQAQAVTEPHFIRAALVTEFVHVVSFAFYHFGHPRGCDEERVICYLAVASLLGHDLMRGVGGNVASLWTPVLTPPRARRR